MELKIIAIEGIDGTGKSTIASLLSHYLTNRGHKVYLTSEPWSSASGLKIHRELGLGIEPSSRLFIEDRVEHLKAMSEALGSGSDVIITDRYLYSNMAYQGSSEDQMKAIYSENINSGIPDADLLLLLDCSVDIALDRIEARDRKKTAFESKEKLELARQNFKTLLGWHRNGIMLDVAAHRDYTLERF